MRFAIWFVRGIGGLIQPFRAAAYAHTSYGLLRVARLLGMPDAVNRSCCAFAGLR